MMVSIKGAEIDILAVVALIVSAFSAIWAWAFGCCTNLKNLVIEGDPSRVANWAKDAFDACACEEQYLRLQNADMNSKLRKGETSC